MGIKVFFCEATSRHQSYLRRFADGPCAGGSYHNAKVPIEIVGTVGTDHPVSGDLHNHADPRWPKQCEHCGYLFGESDSWQLFHEPIYRRLDTGDTRPWPQMPAGACRDLDWLHDRPSWCGYDGRSLEVRTPGGDWMIDGRASNCTMPADRAHRCWIRHGRPEDGNLHVDKSPEAGQSTCAAGGGSIAMPAYHGFLHHGELTSC